MEFTLGHHEKEAQNLVDKQLADTLAHIGAKIADAVELAQKAKTFSASSEALMILAQCELEELYATWGSRERNLDMAE